MANAKQSCGQKENRQTTRVSLKEIAEITKISPQFLSAIENQEFGKLPGGVFDRNYIRQYAAAANLEEAPIVARYEQFLAEREVKTAPPVHRPELRSSPLRWLVSLVTSLS